MHLIYRSMFGVHIYGMQILKDFTVSDIVYACIIGNALHISCQMFVEILLMSIYLMIEVEFIASYNINEGSQ
jgi:hypothetical protein